MDTKSFLDQFVCTKSEYSLSDEDKKTIKFEGIRQFIFKKLNSSKYRAQATEAGYLQKVLDKIDLSVSHNLPVHIVLPTGATKNPYSPTAPGIDWAEVFNIAYLRDYLAPIAKAYKYGVVFHYISVAIFEERVNRIPIKDTDLYDKEFTKLIAFYQKYLPGNFKLIFTRVSDEFSRRDINRLLEIKKTELRKHWREQSQEVRDRKIFRARRNCLYNPKDRNLDEVLLDSALGHDAFCSEFWTAKSAPWDEKPMITLGHNYTSGWAIHVRSAPGSSVNYWSGVGVLEERGQRCLPTILSVNQLNEAKNKIKDVKVNLFGRQFTNLGTIPVLQS